MSTPTLVGLHSAYGPCDLVQQSRLSTILALIARGRSLVGRSTSAWEQKRPSVHLNNAT